jgi:transposase
MTRRLALRNMGGVRFVAMDMWTPYRDVVRAVLPKTTIVVDKFYVARMANYGIEKVRKSLRDSIAPKERRGLMHDRFILLKREHALDVQSRFLLDSWVTLHPILGATYRLKEAFYGIYNAKTRDEAEKRTQSGPQRSPRPLPMPSGPSRGPGRTGTRKSLRTSTIA